LRVNVQLIDAESGHHLWAERFDKPLADMFDMQDEIVAPRECAEHPALRRRGATGGTGPEPRLDDLYFQVLTWYNKGWTPNNVTKARGLFDRALSADPDNVDALVGSASADVLLAHCPL
jgi:hypothetical protein